MSNAIHQAPVTPPAARIPAPAPAAPAGNAKPTLAVDTVAIAKAVKPAAAVVKAQVEGNWIKRTLTKINNFFAEPNRKMATIALSVGGMAALGYHNWAGLSILPPVLAAGLSVALFIGLTLVAVAEKK